MTDKARELLERALKYIDLMWDYENPNPNFMGLRGEICDFLASEKQDQPELVQDEEPIGVVETIDTDEDGDAYAWVGLYQSVNLGDLLYLHPAPVVADSARTEEPVQDDEPVDISDKLEPTVAAVLPNGDRASNVYEAYEAGLKEGTKQDEEPFVYITNNEVSCICAMKTYNFADSWKTNLGFVKEKGDVGLYLHPAPQKGFVRLTEEEVNNLLDVCGVGRDWNYQLICAVENMLVRKNTINKSDPDSINLQSKCRGDKQC